MCMVFYKVYLNFLVIIKLLEKGWVKPVVIGRLQIGQEIPGNKYQRISVFYF